MSKKQLAELQGAALSFKYAQVLPSFICDSAIKEAIRLIRCDFFFFGRKATKKKI